MLFPLRFIHKMIWKFELVHFLLLEIVSKEMEQRGGPLLRTIKLEYYDEEPVFPQAHVEC